jgi:hypothetical protein
MRKGIPGVPMKDLKRKVSANPLDKILMRILGKPDQGSRASDREKRNKAVASTTPANGFLYFVGYVKQVGWSKRGNFKVADDKQNFPQFYS